MDTNLPATTQNTPAAHAEQAYEITKEAIEAFAAASRSNDIELQLQVAGYVDAVRTRLVKPKLNDIKKLAGTPLGFQMDKDKYPDHVLEGCVTEALLRGVRLIGNEFNIIANRCYITKEGFEMKLHKSQVFGLSYQINPGETKDDEKVAHASARWMLGKKEYKLSKTFFVRIHTGWSWEQVQGKATRKLFKAIHDQVTNSAFQEPDDDVREGAIDVGGEEVPEAPPEPKAELPEPKISDDEVKALGDKILGFLGDAEIHPEAFIAHMIEQVDELSAPVGSIYDMVQQAPDLGKYLAGNWTRALKRYRELESDGKKEPKGK